MCVVLVYRVSLVSSQTGTGFFSLDLLFVPCVWGFLIPVLDLLFYALAERLTEWENWRLGSTWRALLVVKVFSFRFVNAFLAVYYYMFADEGALVRLTTAVASFMLMGQLLRFGMSVGAPYVSKKWNGWRAKHRAAEQARQGKREEEEVELSKAWLESTYPEYDHFEDYANMGQSR